MKNLPATIHATLAVGASITAPYFDVNIAQELCSPACADDTPVFAPQFSVASVEEVGTNQYLVKIHVEGIISYMPCGCGCCNTKTQVVSQDFDVPFFSATKITWATLTPGSTYNSIIKQSCKTCSTSFVSDTPLTVAPVTA